MSDDLLLILVVVLAALSLGLGGALVVVLWRLRQRKRRRARRPPLHRTASAAPPPRVEPVMGEGGGPRARLLVAEDNPLVALSLEVMLEDLGYAVVGPARTVEEAMALTAEAESLDGAILDVDLHGEKIFPVAETLRERGVAVIFATGFEQDPFRDSRFRGVPVLLKPYSEGQMEEALRGALGRTARAP